MPNNEVLVLGGESSGKSLLIRRIKDYILNSQLDACDIAVTHEGTLPTIGVELNTITLDGGHQADLREIGSALSSKWESYLQDCRSILFLVDASDPGHVATSLVLLHEILATYHLTAGKPILVALNKTDLTDSATLVQVSNFLRLDELRGGGKVDVAQGSSMDDSLVKEVLSWLNNR
jgi:signal recognition particle receptor subunit beta